jgi:hypothetical protein
MKRTSYLLGATRPSNAFCLNPSLPLHFKDEDIVIVDVIGF